MLSPFFASVEKVNLELGALGVIGEAVVRDGVADSVNRKPTTSLVFHTTWSMAPFSLRWLEIVMSILAA